jgi:hypothetical protein
MKMSSSWVYIVECNKDPIIYGVYTSIRAAIKYAEYLVFYRKPSGFYHYEPYNKTIDWKAKADKMQDREHTLMSACLKIHNNNQHRVDEDGCIVRVVARRITKEGKE